MMNVKVTIDDVVEVQGVSFRIYDDSLWVNGGENDDYFLRELPESVEAEYFGEEFEIEITDTDIANASDYLRDFEIES
jgi:hypothetical protein